MYTIHDAHVGGVTALDISSNGKRLVTGGVDGNVRVWSIEPNVQNMLVSLKEHKSGVSHITVCCLWSSSSIFWVRFLQL